MVKKHSVGFVVVTCGLASSVMVTCGLASSVPENNTACIFRMLSEDGDGVFL